MAVAGTAGARCPICGALVRVADSSGALVGQACRSGDRMPVSASGESLTRVCWSGRRRLPACRLSLAGQCRPSETSRLTLGGKIVGVGGWQLSSTEPGYALG